MSDASGPTQPPPNGDAIDATHPASAQADAHAAAPQPDRVPPLTSALQASAQALDGSAWSGARNQGPHDARFAPEAPGDPLPPLPDPYLTAPPSERPDVSTLAVSSIAALFFGPLGPVASIALGWAARREIARAPGRRSGYGLATAGLVLGVLLTLGWSAGIVAGVWLWRSHRAAEVASAQHEGEAPPEPASTASPAAPAQSPPPAASPPGGSVPQRTTYRRVGAVLVVDVGIDVSTLGEELAKQRAEAYAAGEKVLVMTVSDPCEPCRGVERSLSDPLMQTALRGVRLVRVDIDVFKDDLDQLKMPRRLYPGFFLLSPDLTPQDGINGGEWDDDIARNIAPVLGAFVRGQYTARRQPWQPLPGSGMRL